MGTPESSREPCPDRILDDIGGAFGMGAVGGSAFHFLRGLYNSPNGERMVGGVQAVRMNAPRIGGSFAVWGGLYSTFDCTMVYVRQKEDPWNSIIAGFATGGFLSMRQGLRRASRSAVGGGILLGMIEGAGIMLNRFVTPPNLPPMDDPAFPQNMAPMFPNSINPAIRPSAPEVENQSPSSWFGGVFGGGKEKDDSTSGSSTEILVDPSPPIPNFEFK